MMGLGQDLERSEFDEVVPAAARAELADYEAQLAGIKAEADEASFAAAATELGLVPTVREWAERPTGVAKEGENAFDTWLRNNFAVWSQTEKTVLRADGGRQVTLGDVGTV